MRWTTIFLLASTATAFSWPEASSVTDLFARKNGGLKNSGSSGNGSSSSGSSGSGSGSSGNGKCPIVWAQISKDLTKAFLQDGQCNPLARAAIREIFHDCGAWEKKLGAKHGCDGSLILAGELSRGENNGLKEVSDFLQDLAGQYNVGVADMIVFAGNHAIVTCPGGPRVKTYIGRKDSSTPAPDGLLPDVNAPAADLFSLFKAKGLDERDLAALLGAHSTSNQFHFNTSAGYHGLPQDSTPGVWDVKYYAETLKPSKQILVLPSDAKLAKYGKVGKEFQGFVGNAGKWNGKFADAMGRMALFGSGTTDGKGLVDCTDALPRATNAKRELRAMPVFAPRG